MLLITYYAQNYASIICQGLIIIQVSHEHSYSQSHQNGVCTITQARTCAEEEHVRVAFKREASSIFYSMEQV